MQRCIEVFSLTVDEIKTEGICQCEHIAANWMDSLVVSRQGNEFVFYRILDDSDYENKYRKSKQYQRPGHDKYGSILQSSIPIFDLSAINPMSYQEFCQTAEKWLEKPKRKERKLKRSKNVCTGNRV